MSVGKRIKQLRDYLNLSQEDFAQKIFRVKSTISQLENNKTPLTPSLSSVICMTFNVREAWLVEGQGSMINRVDEITVPYPDPLQGNYHQLDPVQIKDDLLMAQTVLESGTGYATSLHMNIRSFKESVDEKRKREDLEAKQREFENKVSEEIQALKNNFETLQSENRALRTENKNLRDLNGGCAPINLSQGNAALTGTDDKET